MRHLILGALAAVALAACDPNRPGSAPPAAAPVTAHAPQDTEEPRARGMVLSPESFGPVRFGKPLADAEKRLDAKATRLGSAEHRCSYVSFEQLPNVLFMVEKGIVTRADAKQGVPNIAGVDIGTTAAAVRKKYPDAAVTKHQYVAGGHYLTIPWNDRSALVFEEDGATITAVRAGLEPSVSYPEGCS